jgi:adenylate cyclase
MMSKISNKLRSAKTQLSKLYTPSVAFAGSVLIASAVVTLSLIAVRHLGILQSVELGAYDQMLRLRPDETPDSRLLIVGITEGDIQRLKQWPISDRKIAEILQKIEKMQPRAIGLDILRDVPLGEGRQELAKILQKSDRIIGVCLVTDGSAETPGSPPPPGMSPKNIGYADFAVDPGGVLRRSLLFMKPPKIESNSPVEKHLCNDDSQVLFSFNLQLALRYLQAHKIYPQLSTDKSLWLGATQLKQLGNNDGGYKNADVRGYQILINYRSQRQVAKQVTLTDVLEDKIDPNLVKDKIVLIGYTTETVKDFFYTPYSAGQNKDQLMFGIVAHAQVVSQILSAVLDKRPLFWFWPEWVEILWISGWSIVGGILASRMTHPTRLALAFIGTLGICCSISFGIFMLGGWIPVAVPALAFIVTGAIIVSADRFNKSGYGKIIRDKVKQVFKIEIDEGQRKKEVEEVLGSNTLAKVEEWKKRNKHKQNDKKKPFETEPSQTQQKTANLEKPENTKSQPENSLAYLSQTDKPHKQLAIVTQSENDFQTSISIHTSNSNGKKHSPQIAPSQPQEIIVSSELPKNAKSQPEDYLAYLSQTDKPYKQSATATQAKVTRSEKGSQATVSIDASNSNGSAETSPEEEMEQLEVKADFNKRPLPEWIEMLWIWGWSIIEGDLVSRIAHPTRLALIFAATLGVFGSISFGMFMLGGWVAVAATILALIVVAGNIVSTDRFNQAGYGQVISDWVKQIFKIEIDQAKTAEQVPEIIQSEGLQRSKEQMERNQHKQNGSKESSQIEPFPPQEIIVSWKEPENVKTKTQQEEYLAQEAPIAEPYKQSTVVAQVAVTQVAVTQSESDSQTSVPIHASNNHGSVETSLDQEMRRQFQAKAKQMRERRNAAKKIKDLHSEDLGHQEDLAKEE